MILILKNSKSKYCYQKSNILWLFVLFLEKQHTQNYLIFENKKKIFIISLQWLYSLIFTCSNNYKVEEKVSENNLPMLFIWYLKIFEFKLTNFRLAWGYNFRGHNFRKIIEVKSYLIGTTPWISAY